MSNINPTTQSGVLSGFKKRPVESNRINQATLKRNDEDRKVELEGTKRDAKVQIPDAVKDFSRIKKAVDAAPEVDNSDKISALKAQIQNGTYKVDYDAVAGKMLETEF